MLPDGHMDSFQSFNEDRMVDIKQRLFFTSDTSKFGPFIVDQRWNDVTRWDREVIDFTRYRVKNKASLTNLGN